MRSSWASPAFSPTWCPAVPTGPTFEGHKATSSLMTHPPATYAQHIGTNSKSSAFTSKLNPDPWDLFNGYRVSVVQDEKRSWGLALLNCTLKKRLRQEIFYIHSLSHFLKNLHTRQVNPDAAISHHLCCSPSLFMTRAERPTSVSPSCICLHTARQNLV